MIFWSIVVLQCCVTFCCATTWVSYMYTYIQKRRKKKWASTCQHTFSEHSLFTKLAIHFWHSVIYLLDIAKRNCFWRRTSLKVQGQCIILTTVLQYHRCFKCKTKKLHMSLDFYLAELLHFVKKRKVKFQRHEIVSESITDITDIILQIKLRVLQIW